MLVHKWKRGTSCPRFILFGLFVAFMALLPFRGWQVAAADSPAPPPKPRSHFALPSGAGAKLIEANCKRCHTVKRIVSTHRNKREWDVVVRRMKIYGLALSAKDNQVVVEYLALHFGSKRKGAANQPRKPVAGPQLQ
jgi:hypothetical protein